jgi:hypothetical protein
MFRFFLSFLATIALLLGALACLAFSALRHICVWATIAVFLAVPAKSFGQFEGARLPQVAELLQPNASPHHRSLMEGVGFQSDAGVVEVDADLDGTARELRLPATLLQESEQLQSPFQLFQIVVGDVAWPRIVTFGAVIELWLGLIDFSGSVTADNYGQRVFLREPTPSNDLYFTEACHCHELIFCAALRNLEPERSQSRMFKLAFENDGTTALVFFGNRFELSNVFVATGSLGGFCIASVMTEF